MFFGLMLVGLQAGSATRDTASATPTPGPQPTPEQVTVGVYIQNVQAVNLRQIAGQCLWRPTPYFGHVKTAKTI